MKASRFQRGSVGLRFRSVASASPGFTFIEIIVAVAIMLIVFVGFFGAYLVSADIALSAKVKAGGVSLAASQIEYIRTLSYDAVGTAGGTPAGELLQSETKMLNGYSYTLRTIVAYVDAPEDGSAGSDQNGITRDYKSVKVEALWRIREIPQSIATITYITNGIEE